MSESANQKEKELNDRSMASLRGNLRHTCGATILNEWSVLTAAHCVCDDFGIPRDPSIYSIQYGSVHISETLERSVQVSKIFCHQFEMERLINDAAVLELAHPIPHDHHWEPVPLASHFDTTKQHRGIIIGWGRLWENGPIPSVLQKLEVEVYSDEVCSRFDFHQHVCFGAPIGGACNGDSGTALVVEGEQVGIASFITTTCGIASERFPNVYAKVTAFLDFIGEHSQGRN
ncbi:hypothetical protein NQ317_001004 [Molorchus minor]|uniref:Peptidase S1 domain-containing protein n=1 Tax=Molorchus minor TaxID=1323400 RepID=A0ABQ9JBY2_9CUCU|nr:hypothetical protein NQ317_001004 [Molorchus minor]